VLWALYQYHALRPERYGKLDMTTALLSRSLDLDEKAILRVLGPMEENGEVRTMKSTSSFNPYYVTLTHKGIEAIDSEPLFERRGGVTVQGDHIEVRNSQGVAVTKGNDNTVTQLVRVDQLNELTPLLEALRGNLRQLELSPEKQKEALEVVDSIEEEAARPEARKGILKNALTFLGGLTGGLASQSENVSTVLEQIGKIRGALGL